jgi:hypothetical protein
MGGKKKEEKNYKPKAHSERAELCLVTACYRLCQRSDKVMCKRHPLSEQIQTERDKCVKYQYHEIRSAANEQYKQLFNFCGSNVCPSNSKRQLIPQLHYK